MDTLQRSEPAPIVDPMVAELARHRRPVWRYLRLLGADDGEADDLSQDAFVKVQAHVAKGRDIRDPLRFLCGVARRLFFDARRAAQRRVPTVAWTESVDALVAKESWTFEDGYLDALATCRQRLNGKSKVAVELRYGEALAYRECAQRMGLRLNGFKALLRRTQALLRECVEQRMRNRS